MSKPAQEYRIDLRGWQTPPVLTGCGLIVGILAVHLGLPLFGFLVAASLSVFALRRWTPLLLFVLGVGIGGLRFEHTRTTPPNVPKGLIRLEGEYDGQLLHSELGPVLLRSALLHPALLHRGKPSPRPGFIRATGRLSPIRGNKNFGTFDLQAWYANRGVYSVLEAETIKSQPSQGWHKAQFALREHMTAGIRTGLGHIEGAFVQALVLGDGDEFAQLPADETPTSATDTRNTQTQAANTRRSTMEGRDWRTMFTRAGLAHVLALSGQQVTLLALAFGLTLRTLGTRRYPFVLAALACYAFIIIPSPSATRALIMATSSVLSMWLGRGRLEAPSAIGLATSLSLLLEPRSLFELGFALSYLAVLGLVILVPPLIQRFRLEFPREGIARRPLGWLRATTGIALTSTCAAQVFTLPIAASSFGYIPILNPITNLIATPLISLLVPLGTLAGLLGPTLGQPVNWLVQPLAKTTLELARLAAEAPVLPWGTVSAAGYLAWFAFAIAVVLLAYHQLQPKHLLTVTLGAILATTLPKLSLNAEVVFLDVGQGDATLIRLGDDNVLIDGGGSPGSDFDIGARVLEPALRALGVSHLRAIVATHADTDHIEGLISLFGHMPIGALIVGARRLDDPLWQKLEHSAKNARVGLQTVRTNETLHLGQTAALRILNPKQRLAVEDNTNSIVILLEYTSQGGVRRVLLPGDIPSSVEDGVFLKPVDVLKLAHHGSRRSSGERFLKRLSPRIAVISAGIDNRYGHPHRETLERLNKLDIQTYRTDLDGAIRFDLETGRIQIQQQ